MADIRDKPLVTRVQRWADQVQKEFYKLYFDFDP